MCACVSGGRIREQKVTLSSNFALKRGGGRNNEGGVTTREYGKCRGQLGQTSGKCTLEHYDTLAFSLRKSESATWYMVYAGRHALSKTRRK